MLTRKSKKNSPKTNKESLIILPYKSSRFWKNIPFIFKQLKWAVIRGIYGWSPHDVWDMDDYLLKILPEMLTYLAYHHVATPGTMLFEGYKEDEAFERWTQKLLEIAEYFKQAKLWDTPLEEELLEGKITYQEYEKLLGENLHKALVELENCFYDLWD